MCLVLATGLLTSVLAASPAADAAFALFWKADNPSDAQKAADAIAKSGVTFDEALARLKEGRTYSATAPKGIVRLSNRIGSTDFPYIVEVPETYTPDRKYQVRVQLHGGVGRPDASQRGNGIGALAGAEQIYVLPTAWAEAEWWTDRQLENIRAILDHVKRTYNVDENRVVLSGVSDGGTAAYYVAMREMTPFASFLPLNGAIAVLRSSNVSLDGELYPNNYLNKPFFIVNGGTRSAVSDLARRALHRAHAQERRDADLPAAGRRRAQHVVVARGQGYLRGVRHGAPAESAA